MHPDTPKDFFSFSFYFLANVSSINIISENWTNEKLVLHTYSQGYCPNLSSVKEGQDEDIDNSNSCDIYRDVRPTVSQSMKTIG